MLIVKKRYEVPEIEIFKPETTNDFLDVVMISTAPVVDPVSGDNAGDDIFGDD